MFEHYLNDSLGFRSKPNYNIDTQLLSTSSNTPSFHICCKMFTIISVDTFDEFD